jgi:hypothetical protein
MLSAGGGHTRSGTWDNLTMELYTDLKNLEDMLYVNKINISNELIFSYRPIEIPMEFLQITGNFPEKAKVNRDLKIEIYMTSVCEHEVLPVLHYRHMDQTEGLFHTVKMTPCPGGYLSIIPAEYIITCFNLQIYVTLQGSSGTCVIFPGIYHSFYPYPYHVIIIED